MDYNNENENKDFDSILDKKKISFKEKGNGNNIIWYVVIIILVLGLFGWYGYTAGWFSKDIKNINNTKNTEDASSYPFNNTNDTKAQINNLTINTSDDFPVKKTLVVMGDLVDNCHYLNDPQVIRDGNIFYVNLTTREEKSNDCGGELIPYEKDIELEVVGLPAGVYYVVVNGNKMMFELEQDNSIDFSAGEEK